MKAPLLYVSLALLTSAGTLTQARQPQSLPDPTGLSNQSADGRAAGPFQALADRLKAAIKSNDLSAIFALYRTNGVPAAELARESAKWRQTLLEDAEQEVSLFGKELATLPSEEARRFWSEYAQRLTKRPVTHLVMARFGNGRQLVLPLILVDGRLWIVPSEREQPRIEPKHAADESRSLADPTSSAGSHR